MQPDRTADPADLLAELERDRADLAARVADLTTRRPGPVTVDALEHVTEALADVEVWIIIARLDHHRPPGARLAGTEATS